MSCNCENQNLTRCGNPCGVSADNSAACESLPSQIQNFTTQFFGTVVKTEIDGAVTWSLPCGLDVGLPNNPRDSGEGLACYFLRLFDEGIVGLTGPQGEPGANGADGRNAYTVTLASFTQPSLAAPNVTVLTAYNPAILAGLYIFIATSGWYLVNAADTTGTLFLTMVKELSGAPATITAGKLVVPSGFPGASVTGPQGVQGTQGEQGDPATNFTTDNDLFFRNSGTPYNIQIAYANVDFTSSQPTVLLPAIGRYLVTAIVQCIGLAGIALADVVSVKLWNSTISGDIDGSEKRASRFFEDQLFLIVINTIVETDAVNQTIRIRAKCSSADVVAVEAPGTTITYVRLE